MSLPGMRAVALQTLGCKVNRAESERFASELLGCGVRLAVEDEADVIVINTCTVTSEADAKARKAVRRALKSAGHPLVVVTGCLAAIDGASLSALGDRVVVEADKSKVSARVAGLLGVDSGESVFGAPRATRAPGAFRTRAAVKVEDGCDAYCSYCIVPFARGVPRSVPLTEVTSQVEALAEAGVREIVLTGINIGRYRDPVTGTDLAGLIEAVAGSGVARLRVSSIEPLDLTARLLDTLARAGAACAHLHVPLQAGSDAVLSAMGRAYTTAEYAERIEAARSRIPGLTVTTDVMVGFPDETDEQAAETRAFCERMGFSKLHVFRYSRRPGTLAAAMSGQVLAPVKAARAAALRDVGDALRRRFERGRIGGEAIVLVESIEGAIAVGTSEDYLRVRFPAAEVGRGDLVKVRVTAVEADHVLGETIQGRWGDLAS
ncbi:MAG: tRNA (N(6)-L-threonylcarbamoyladenosine(37)-C(2))-methylthiotransferase MtaB [Coriobacteriia bacterium]|nr:tRNA (N(6)-L-threonylcarbamoyladenosine(37)-C(2))-methylthiotransferase MtaB [Coriobacteriia bacterium]